MTIQGTFRRRGTACPLAFATLIALLVLTAACAPVRQRAVPAQYSVITDKQAGDLTIEEEALLERLCPLGAPVRAADWDHGWTEYVVRRGYALEHSGQLKIPLWVCEYVEPGQLAGSMPRKDRFRPDPALEGPRAELADYRGSGYDRGHHAPAANQTTEQELKDETFYLSNMSPQAGAFNQQVWRELEMLTRDWARQRDGTWMITGALLYEEAEENPETADGWIEYEVIGTVAVPTHLFKIVVSHADDGVLQTVAFVVENRGYSRPFRFDQFIRPIRWIEERTGLDFLPGLTPGEQDALEVTAGELW